MKRKSLSLLIKQKEMEIEKITFDLSNIKECLSILQKREKALLQTLGDMQKRSYERAFDLLLANEAQKEIHRKIAKIQKEQEALQKEEERIKEALQEVYSQKRGLQKLLESQKRWEEKREYEKENRLANENFLHHHRD